MTTVTVTQEAAAELETVAPSVRPALVRAAARLRDDPGMGKPVLADPSVHLLRIDVTDGVSIVYWWQPDADQVLITQFAQPHMLTVAICLDEVARVEAEFSDPEDPIREVLADLAAVARSTMAEVSA